MGSITLYISAENEQGLLDQTELKIDLKNVTDLETKVKVLNAQYIFDPGVNSKLTAYLGAIIESPVNTKWQVFELCHSAVSDLYDGSDEEVEQPQGCHKL